jgi:hypothetical protein
VPTNGVAARTADQHALLVKDITMPLDAFAPDTARRDFVLLDRPYSLPELTTASDIPDRPDYPRREPPMVLDGRGDRALVIVYQSLARRRRTLKRDSIHCRALTVSHAPSASQTAKVSINTATRESHRISPQVPVQSTGRISSSTLNATETTSPAAPSPIVSAPHHVRNPRMSVDDRSRDAWRGPAHRRPALDDAAHRASLSSS